MLTTAARLTVEEFYALPERADIRRELIQGVVEEDPMSTSCPDHADAVSLLSFFLTAWLREQPKPLGKISGGDVRCLISDDTVVGIDVAYFPPSATRTNMHYLGPPVLAIEIVSPSDRASALSRKCRLYLEAGTAQVWIVNPYEQSITVHRAGQAPVAYISGQAVSGEPELPGLRLAVTDIMPELAVADGEGDE